MTWKKTWFSKVLWVLKTVLTALFLTGTCGIFLDKYGLAEKYSILPGYNRLVWLGIIFVLFFVVSLLVYLILRLIVGRISHIQVNQSAKIAIEVLLFIGFLAGGILYRLYIFPSEVATNAYYELAAVNTTQAPVPMAHGALYMYILLLHGLFLVVGNHIVAGIILQMVLQLFASVILYGAVRRIAGVLPAIWTLGFLMFSPTIAKTGLAYTPETLYLLLGGILLWMLSSVLKMITKTEKYKWYHYILLLLFGICIAFMIYLDVLGMVFLLGCFALFGINKTEEIPFLKGANLPLFLISLLGVVGGFLGIFVIDALQSGSGVAAIAGVWEWLYIPEGGTTFSYLYHQLFLRLSDNPIVTGFIFAGMTWGIYGFFHDRERDREMLWLLMAFTGIFLSYACPASGNMDRSIFGLLYMVILSGIGVRIAVSGKNMKPEVQEETMAEEIYEEETLTEEMASEPLSSEAAITEEVVPERGIKYIENPLPLPKKHVKKTMDYGYEVAEDQMEFDVEIAEDDDFDF